MDNIRYEDSTNIRYLSDTCPFRVGYNEDSKESQYNWHENVEAVYVTRGHGTIRCGETHYKINEGTVAIINSDTPHYISSTVGISYYFIIIDSRFFAENGIRAENYIFEPIIRDVETERLFILCINAIEKLVAGESELNNAEVRRNMLDLIIGLCRDHSTAANSENKPQKKESHDYVRAALKYIGDNYLEAVSLEEIAAGIGITKYYLVREFKKYTGQTIFSYMNKLRCRKAEMLLSKGKSITEAAYESGFESAAYFARTYKKLRGYSPSEYKKNMKNNSSRLEIFPS